ncbi:MAG: SRPBCC family protein [Deltaproteobacteria bacterium]|nr:SRPBCC family protein [Deltaproteobacteria bacterium]
MAASLLGLAVGTASCASSKPAQSEWPDEADRRAPDELPIVVEEEPGEEPEQTGVAGRLRQPTREAVPIEGSDLVRGRSTVMVNAPIDQVRDVVFDYDRYAEFMPHYRASRIVGRASGGGRQLYQQWEALHGAVKLWARFDMRKVDGPTGIETYESEFIEGNVKLAFARWSLEAQPGDQTKLTLEIFLHPRIPIPSSLLNGENLDNAVKGVTAMRDRIEQGR